MVFNYSMSQLIDMLLLSNITDDEYVAIWMLMSYLKSLSTDITDNMYYKKITSKLLYFTDTRAKKHEFAEQWYKEIVNSLKERSFVKPLNRSRASIKLHNFRSQSLDHKNPTSKVANLTLHFNTNLKSQTVGSLTQTHSSDLSCLLV